MTWRFYFGALLGSGLGEVTGQASAVTHGIFFASSVVLVLMLYRAHRERRGDLPKSPRSR